MKNLGRYILFLISLFQRRERFKTYFSLIINECIKIGYDSLFIVCIVSAFMGAVTTLQTAFNIDFLKSWTEKLTEDVEKLIRNGSGH